MDPPRHAALVFVGGNGFVYGIHTADGSVAWERELKPGWFKTGNRFVSLMEDREHLYAFAYGTLFTLRKSDGEVLMKGDEIPHLKHHAGVFSTDPDASAGGTVAIELEGADVDGDGSGHDGSAGHSGGQ